MRSGGGAEKKTMIKEFRAILHPFPGDRKRYFAAAG